MQELETESSWQEYVALMTERPELFREEGYDGGRFDKRRKWDTFLL